MGAILQISERTVAFYGYTTTNLGAFFLVDIIYI